MSAAANIVFLLPDLGGGGAQQVMLTLARHLNRARFTPRLLVLGTNDIFAGNVPGDLPVERANASRLRNGLPWLVKRLRALRPDIVVSTLAYTNLALLAIGPLLPGNVRIIVREANTPDATLASLPAYVSGKWLYRWLYPRAARVLAQTDSIAKTLAAIAPGIRGKLSIMQNPVDVARLRQRAEMPRRAQGPGLRLIGAGRLTHQKGFDRLIEIAARLSHESRITIFGEGPDRGALSARIHALGLASRIELAGFTPDLPAHLAGADALVMPSRWEGLPNVALESLAVGTPVLASGEAALQDIAMRSPHAVSIAASDDDFVAQLNRWPATADAPPAPRPSLLPDEYEAAAIAERLQFIFIDVLNGH